ncbi:MAG: PD-(D/E)XK nuclease family protein [Pelagibacteraceae bacterium]|nr:PD-(D/E)XK nuclease family protein [Pelagibacteraceae bacterium]
MALYLKKFKFIDVDTSKLPNVKGRNQAGFRFYDIDGENYPSVTSVLGIKKKKELQKWRDSIGEKVANWEMGRAARRGKATHTLVEQYLKGETPSERSVLPLGMFRLMKPYVDKIDNVHLIEQVMYSKKLTIAGQVDCVAEYGGKLSVIDFKTANKERIESWVESYFLQTTAYALMYEELFGKPIEQIVVLIAGEDGSMTAFIKERKDYEEKLGQSIKDFYKYFDEQNRQNSS